MTKAVETKTATKEVEKNEVSTTIAKGEAINDINPHMTASTRLGVALYNIFELQKRANNSALEIAGEVMYIDKHELYKQLDKVPGFENSPKAMLKSTAKLCEYVFDISKATVSEILLLRPFFEEKEVTMTREIDGKRIDEKAMKFELRHEYAGMNYSNMIQAARAAKKLEIGVDELMLKLYPITASDRAKELYPAYLTDLQVVVSKIGNARRADFKDLIDSAMAVDEESPDNGDSSDSSKAGGEDIDNSENGAEKPDSGEIKPIGEIAAETQNLIDTVSDDSERWQAIAAARLLTIHIGENPTPNSVANAVKDALKAASNHGIELGGLTLQLIQ